MCEYEDSINLRNFGLIGCTHALLSSETSTAIKGNLVHGNLIHGYGLCHTNLVGIYTLSDLPEMNIS